MDAEPLDDLVLVRAYLRGDKSAFTELVKRYRHMVYNLSFRLSGRAEDAEDLTQEIFVRLLNKISTWRQEAKFSTWLYTLALNHCREHLRKQKPGTVAVDDAVIDPRPRPDEQAHNRDIGEKIFQALLELPLDSRAVVFLRDVEGLSYAEIAGVLELELGTVKSRLARARAVLAAKLMPALIGNKPGAKNVKEDRDGLRSV